MKQICWVWKNILLILGPFFPWFLSILENIRGDSNSNSLPYSHEMWYPVLQKFHLAFVLCHQIVIFSLVQLHYELTIYYVSELHYALVLFCFVELQYQLMIVTLVELHYQLIMFSFSQLKYQQSMFSLADWDHSLSIVITFLKNCWHFLKK